MYVLREADIACINGPEVLLVSFVLLYLTRSLTRSQWAWNNFEFMGRGKGCEGAGAVCVLGEPEFELRVSSFFCN